MGIMWDSQHLFNMDPKNIYWASSVVPDTRDTILAYTNHDATFREILFLWQENDIIQAINIRYSLSPLTSP